MWFDGIQSNYYTNTSDHLASFYLPPKSPYGPSSMLISQILEAPEEITNMFLSITDPKKNTRRIIQRKNGHLDFDTTMEFKDNKLSKVRNNPAASFNGIVTAVFDKKWWQED